jgi:hypothetical protein
MDLLRRSGGSADVEHVARSDDVATEVEPVQNVQVDHDRVGNPGGDVPPAAPRRPSLAALLTETGIASEEQIRAALEEGERTGEMLGEVVVRRGLASEGRLAQLLAEQWGLRYVGPGALSLDPLAVSRVEIGLASELGGFPVWFDQQGIVIAVSEPNDERFEAFRYLVGDASFVVVPRSTLRELMESRLFGSGNRAGEHLSGQPADMSIAATSAAGAGKAAEPAWSGNGEHHGRSGGQLREEQIGAREDWPATPTASESEAQDSAVSAPLSLVERLRSIAAEVQAFEQALEEARAREAELAALREARGKDLDRIRGLEAELVERDHRLHGLRERVADLSLVLDDYMPAPAG